MDSSKRFLVGKQFGGGAFGQLFEGVDKRSGRRVAIKLESRTAKHPQILYEARIYGILNGCKGVPEMVWSGPDGNHNVLVMELLGWNLEQLFTRCGRRFSLKTVLMLADSLLYRVQLIHEKGFVHRDIKPDNFVFGTGDRAKHLYIIDFGLAKAYRTVEGNHIPFRDDKSLTGTPRYASAGAHAGHEQGRRDDLEAVGYVLLYFLQGSLPWQHAAKTAKKGTSKHERYDYIGKIKSSMTLEAMCLGAPNAFKDYLVRCRALAFDECPDYASLRNVFRALYHQNGFSRDNVFDWDVLTSLHSPVLYEEHHQPPPTANSSPLMKQMPVIAR